MTPRTPVRCALLSTVASGWFTDLLCACPGLELFALPTRELGLEGDPSTPPPAAESLRMSLDGLHPNPYGLPLIDRPDVVLMTVNWYAWLEAQGEAAVDRVFAALRTRTRAVVGLEGLDMFTLRMSPAGIERVDLLLKAQGLYRDLELYNYEVGPYYPGANWTKKLNRRSDAIYRREHFEKLRLSLPCFIGADRRIRARVRRVKAALSPLQRAARTAGDWLSGLETAILRPFFSHPTRTTHCTVYLSHIQRLELLIWLKQMGVSGLLGISQVPPHIFGTPHFEEPLPEAELAAIRATIAEHGLGHAPLNRNRFKRTMLSHKLVIAPTGYGELTFRQAEAWEQGRALVCQDLSHVETMFPFQEGRNVLYCRPDFSDLGGLLRAVEADAVDWQRIGVRGRADWRAWIADREAIFERGVVRHIEEALGTPPGAGGRHEVDTPLVEATP